MITALAGGVGAAKFLGGLEAVVDPGAVTVVVNTGDDFELHGLSICPDIDTVTYSLAGLVDPERGWGRRDETWAAMEALEGLADGAPPGSTAGLTWFRLGDRDLATHLYRTQRLAEGAALSMVTAELARVMGVAPVVVPMTDSPVRTRVELAQGGEVSFQHYFVRLAHAVAVDRLDYQGASGATPAPGVIEALDAAEAVVICPSNPLCSIGPLRAVPALEEALRRNRARVVAVSPLVGGRALRGPADRLMADLGHEPTVVGVARMYSPVASALVIDPADAQLAGEVERAGLRPVVTPAVMHDLTAAARLAEATLAALGR